MLADRVLNIHPSGIRKVFDLAATLKDPIDLSIGQAHFDVPEPIKDIAIRSIEQGFNKYTVTQGIAPLNDVIRRQLREKFSVEPESVFVTSGVSGGLMLAFLTLVNPGDEVLIPDPFFVMYKILIELCGGKAVYYSTYPDFKIRREELEKNISGKTKIILVNAPQNPTGACYSGDELKLVAEVAASRDLLVMSDEIYERFVYDDPHQCMMSYYPKTILLSGFSKSFAMPGWRVGYVAGPEKILDKMKTLQQFSFVCAPSPFQVACAEAIDFDMTEYIMDYRRKRDMAHDGLKDAFQITKPGGSFYMFPRVPWENAPSQEFVEAAIKRNLILVPGKAFSGADTHFRLSFAAPDEKLKRGIDALNDLAKNRP